jgi:hypothetical protein
MSPTFARKTSFERRGASSINDKKAARASVAVSKFQLDSYFKQVPSASTSEDNKTDTDTDSEIKPMKIGAFSVAQRGGARRGRRSSEEVEEGYATTSAVSPRPDRSPVSITDPKRPRASPGTSAAAGADPAGKRPKVKRVSTLDFDMPEPKSPSGKKRGPSTPVQETKVAPLSADSKAARRSRKEDDAGGVGYSTDYAGSSSTRPKKIRVKEAEPVAPKATVVVASPSSPAISSKPKASQTPFSDVEDSPSSKHRRRRKDKTSADDVPEFHAPLSEPIILPIKNASPTKNRTPVRTPTESPAGSRNGSPSKRGTGDNVLVPLVVERHRGSDRSKRLSMQLGYATDAPPSRPRGSSSEKKKSSRKSSRETDALPAATASSSTSAVSAPVIMSDLKASDSPRKKKRMFAKQDSPRHQESPRSDGPDSPKPTTEEPLVSLELATDAAVTASALPAEPSTDTANEPTVTSATVEVEAAEVDPLEGVSTALPPHEQPVVDLVSSSEVVVVAAEVPEPASAGTQESASAPTPEPETQETSTEALVTVPAKDSLIDTVLDVASTNDVTPEPVPAVLQESPTNSSNDVSPVEAQTVPASPTIESISAETPVEARSAGPVDAPASSESTSSETPVPPSEIPVASGTASPTTLSPSSSASNISSTGGSRSKIDRTSSIVENAASRTLSRQTSIKEVLNADDPQAKSQLMKNFFTGLGVTKKK